MVEPRQRCPKCRVKTGSEVWRTFTLTHDDGKEARGRIDIQWICDRCGTEWSSTSRVSWRDDAGKAARNPTEYRERVERYAKRLYNRIFDFPPGAFRDDPEAFHRKAERFRTRLWVRYHGRAAGEIAERFVERAARKLLARWEPPVNFKYDEPDPFNRRRTGKGEGHDTHGP